MNGPPKIAATKVATCDRSGTAAPPPGPGIHINGGDRLSETIERTMPNELIIAMNAVCFASMPFTFE
jgi:hypothetical protein